MKPVPDEIRAFVAVNIPDELRAAAGRAVGDARRLLNQVRWVEPVNLHVTVKFLGETGRAKLAEVAGRLETVGRGVPPFRLGMAGIGAFPSIKRPRVIFIDLREGREEMMRLISAVEAALGQIGFAPDDRKGMPHLTLGRVKRPGGEDRLLTWWHANREIDLGGFTVREFNLMKSRLCPQGPVYEILNTFPLTGKLEGEGAHEGSAGER